MKTTYVVDPTSGKLVRAELYYATRPRKARSPLFPAPRVIIDVMADTWHPAANKYFDSKSAFRAATKAAGCEEIGTSEPTASSPTVKDNIKADIAQAFAEHGA